MTAIQDIPLKTIKGEDATLADYAGKVLLVVNVASKCGLTPQYEGLEKLYKDYQDKGLVVLGFPANDFKEQEPGSNDEIATFCTTNYGVDFPLFEKLVVTGPDKHPLYAELTRAIPEKTGEAQVWRDQLKGYGIETTEDPEVLWNFEKFLIDRDGVAVGRFSPQITPDNPALVSAIDKALG